MPKKFVFRANQTIGAAAAESDWSYLSKCFVETGDYNILSDCSDPRNLLVGRTGSGKSALILRLGECEDYVIQVQPEALALSFIANSNVLQFFAEVGVKMDIFYRLLWRHVFCVELLKRRFNIDTEEQKVSFLEKLWGIVPKKKQHEAALAYLREWGESFWKDTEYRIKEVTTRLETELRGSVEAKVPNIGSLNAGTAQKLGEEQRAEVVARAQEVVNKVQIQKLSAIMGLIEEVLLTDHQKKYYIVIDKLDEDWVEENLRYRLIRALIETSVEFSRMPNVKVVVAIRSDLLDRVYRNTRDSGFQEEKYRTCSLDLSWTRNDLIQVLDTRIGALVKDQYTNSPVTHKDVLPAKIGKQASIDYILDRTLMRPRDVIQFFNVCIAGADGSASISVSGVREAEGRYSRERLKALFDEWYGIYPNLQYTFQVLKGRGTVFSVNDLTFEQLENNALALLVSNHGVPGLDLDLINDYVDRRIEGDIYRRELVLIFYKVGLVGLKVDSSAGYSWSTQLGVSVSSAEVSECSRVQLQKMFWRVLGTYDKDEE